VVPAPLVIEPMSTGLFGHRSTGFLTGSEGKATYALDDGGTMFWLEWSNPFIGAGRNKSGGDWGARRLACGDGHPGRRKQRAPLQIGDVALASATQLNWQTCGECKLLFHAEGEGSCPGSSGFSVFIDPDAPPNRGGGHAFTAHGRHAGAGYLLQARTEPRIRLAQNAAPAAACSMTAGRQRADAGRLGGHQPAAGGKNFHIPFIVAEELVGSGRRDWRFCNKRHGLFYNDADAQPAASTSRTRTTITFSRKAELPVTMRTLTRRRLWKGSTARLGAGPDTASAPSTRTPHAASPYPT
jgi:hypothetical protein